MFKKQELTKNDLYRFYQGAVPMITMMHKSMIDNGLHECKKCLIYHWIIAANKGMIADVQRQRDTD